MRQARSGTLGDEKLVRRRVLGDITHRIGLRRTTADLDDGAIHRTDMADQQPVCHTLFDQRNKETLRRAIGSAP